MVMNLIDFLMQQHDDIGVLFHEGDTNAIIMALRLHDAIEMAILYPEARSVGLRVLVEHAEKEHELMRDLLNRASSGDDVMAALEANVRQHIEEEEAELFPQLRSHVSDERLEILGSQASSMGV